MCVYMRERERGTGHVCRYEREKEGEGMCVYMRERKRERAYVYIWERRGRACV